MDGRKVAVVGAGVAGLLVAYSLRSEARVFEAARPGVRGRRCAGIVSLDTLSRLPEAGKFVEELYRVLELAVPELGLRASVASREPFACKLNRAAHEERLAELLEGRVEIVTGTRVRSVKPRGGGALVEWKGGGGLYGAAVIAEGYPPLLSRQLGLAPPIEARLGLHAPALLSGGEENAIYVAYSPRLLGGFAWAASIEGERYSVGAVIGKGGSLGLKEAVRLLNRLFCLSLKVVGAPVGGFVLRGYPRRIATGRVFVFGDAAAMVKSVSGGGLYAISALAKPLAEMIDAAVTGGTVKPESAARVEHVLATLRRGFILSRHLDGLIGRMPRVNLRLEASVRKLEYDDHATAVLQIASSVRSLGKARAARLRME